MFKIMDMAIWPINKLINSTLQLDPESMHKITPLAGKVLAIVLSGTKQTIFVYLQVDAIQLSFSYNGTPDTTLIGTPLAFMRFLMQTTVTALSSDIQINGDPHFAQQLQIILHGLSIDWEEQLSKFIGDHAAHQMGRLGKSVQKWLSDLQAELRRDTTVYLQHETQQLPDRQAVNIFLTEVDVLRNDVERLAMRIKKLST